MRTHFITAYALLTVATAIHAQEAPATTQTAAAQNNPLSDPAKDDVLLSAPDKPMIEYVPAQAGAFPNPNQIQYFEPFGSTQGSAEGAGSFIVFSPTEPKTLDEMGEDLNILGFILHRNLQKALGEQRPDYKLGVPMLLQPGDRLIHASQIEGFGALLNLRVRFPLAAPPAATATSKPAEGPSEWEKAKRDLYGGNSTTTVDSRWAENSYHRAEPYDANVVEILKKQVRESLKSAANLRHVKPEEWIVVTITGSPNVPATQLGTADATGGLGSSSVQPGGAVSLSSGRATIMTIRVKKSTAEALAAKTISPAEFESKVEVNTYVGADVASGAARGGFFRNSAGYGQLQRE
jgi:hypothetical protein